ncbi:hypothetical protein BDQ17DRAFT_779175 [Cyathus striatus]|nr:hypothetical protein BDQ17DRAFT_779175 [Cyathus striatus]
MPRYICSNGSHQHKPRYPKSKLSQNFPDLDIVHSCMWIVGDFKSLSERDASKIAAFSCIGDIMRSFGSQDSSNNPLQISNNSQASCNRLPSEGYPETNEKSTNRQIVSHSKGCM